MTVSPDRRPALDKAPQERNFHHGCTPIHADAAYLDRLSGIIIGCAFRVMNKLGTGFSEKVYENALAHEMRKAGLTVSQQHRIAVSYDEIIVGEYVADLLVDGLIVVELKVARSLTDEHVAQCINYLAATGLHLCLLLNFAKSRVQIQRVVHGFK
jgi:GxxExxY protein